MLNAKRTSKRKLRTKVVPMIGAGLSLSLANGVSAATGGPASNQPTQNAVVSHEVTLLEEEICDVTLATFFDRENGGTFRRAVRRFAQGGCGCGCSVCGGCPAVTDYAAPTVGSNFNPPRYSIEPAYKHTHPRKRTRAPKRD
jgi:hypothetical protein